MSANVSEQDIAPAILCAGRYRKLDLPDACLPVRDFQRNGDTAKFLIGSDHYTHAVHFGPGG